MKKEMILFDLDGTLLPMDMDYFVSFYFSCLAAWMEPYGYNPEHLKKTVWKGVEAMVANDGTMTNEQRFWLSVKDELDQPYEPNLPHFLSFYENGFWQAWFVTGTDPRAAETIERLKQAGIRRALATSPLFPRTATLQRIRWAGLQAEDFELITTYESCTTSKPNPRYFADVCAALQIDPQACIMVGNDADEDYAAVKAGIDVFLLDDHLINRHDRDLSAIPHGSYPELWACLAKEGIAL